jgi:hypothetical protein
MASLKTSGVDEKDHNYCRQTGSRIYCLAEFTKHDIISFWTFVYLCGVQQQ